MKPARALNVNIRADLSEMRHFGSEMGPKSVARNFSFVLILFEASLTFYVDSYALSGSLDNEIDSSLRDKGRQQKEIEWSPRPLQTNGVVTEGPRQVPQQPLKWTNDYEKWLKLFTFDKSKNSSEIDTGTGNESKLIVISEKEHFEVYEKNEEEDEIGNQLRENIFHLLNSENFLSHLTTGHSRNLQRSKREADDEPKKRRCRCRRVWRRTGVRRRRRRRRRNGQQNQRRRRQRRRRRRCVCRKKDGEEGKTDVEKPEDEGSGESGGGGDEGGDGDEEGGEGDGEGGEGDGEAGEGDGEAGEGDGDGEGEEDEGSGEDTDEESSNEEDGEGKDPLNSEGGRLVSPGGMIPIPPGSMVWVPGHGMPSYPNIMPPPNIMPNVGSKP